LLPQYLALLLRILTGHLNIEVIKRDTAVTQHDTMLKVCDNFVHGTLIFSVGTIEALDLGLHGRQLLELSMIQKLESSWQVLTSEVTTLMVADAASDVGQPSPLPVSPLPPAVIVSNLQAALGADSVTLMGEKVLEAASKIASEAGQDVMAEALALVPEQERTLWTEEAFKCMEALGQWGDLFSQVKERGLICL
jgi:hypothetical protein